MATKSTTGKTTAGKKMTKKNTTGKNSARKKADGVAKSTPKTVPGVAQKSGATKSKSQDRSKPSVKTKTTSAVNGTLSVNAQGGAFARKAAPEPEPATPEFQSDLALDIMEELYPLLLENCTDADDEIDTQAVFEVLAGLIGLFAAEYHENYGAEKAATAFQDLVALALATYQQRIAQTDG